MEILVSKIKCIRIEYSFYINDTKILDILVFRQ